MHFWPFFTLDAHLELASQAVVMKSLENLSKVTKQWLGLVYSNRNSKLDHLYVHALLPVDDKNHRLHFDNFCVANFYAFYYWRCSVYFCCQDCYLSGSK